MSTASGSYRLQITKDFTLFDAAAIVPYLRALGVSHVYLSPLMEARAGSNHGYDVTDMNRLSAERGGEEGFHALVAALGEDMRLIVDIVPNHMAADMRNPYWRDALKKGPQSRYRHWFDLFPDAEGKLVLPRLSDNAPPAAEEKYYRLAKWDDDSYTYRRFFHLKEFVGLRVEDPDVLQQTHAGLRRLLAQTKAVSGLRVDHIDGLAAPAAYVRQLRSLAPQCNIWVEKILSGAETLRLREVAGTTGYDFIYALNGLFIHRHGFRHMERWWQREVEPEWKSFEGCLLESKREVLAELFPSVMRALAGDFAETGKEDTALRFLCDLTAHLPVYRVYGYAWKDRQILLRALQDAAGKDAIRRKEYKKLLRRLLSSAHKKTYRAWQQISGGIMAKGLEDRAHYRYTPLAAVNEVGCMPQVLAGRHAFCENLNRRAMTQPRGMNATSTHDTKRSEDVRARLYALADMPLAWQKLYEQARALPDNHGIPPATLYFFLQAVVGTWPLTAEMPADYIARLQDYMEKSACEEARHTGYTDADDAYRQNLRHFVAAVLQQPQFICNVQKFMRRLAPCGALNALSVLALKCLSPGQPDIYQGCDLWDFSLVDPDNRRPVDYTYRAQILRTLAQREGHPALLRLLCRGWKRGWVKLWLTQKLLHVRKCYMTAENAEMQTVETDGPFAAFFHAYALFCGAYVFLVVHPLHPGRLGDLSGGIMLPSHICDGVSLRLPPFLPRLRGIDLISGDAAHAGAVSRQLARFPVAISLFKREGTFETH